MPETQVTNDIPAILARNDAATKGPWAIMQHWPLRIVPAEQAGLLLGGSVDPVDDRRYAQDIAVVSHDNWCSPEFTHRRIDFDQSSADAEFIAHSRTDVPNMAAEILSLRAQHLVDHPERLAGEGQVTEDGCLDCGHLTSMHTKLHGCIPECPCTGFVGARLAGDEVKVKRYQIVALQVALRDYIPVAPSSACVEAFSKMHDVVTGWLAGWPTAQEGKEK